MGAELLLLLVPIAESSVVLPLISPSSTNIIPVGAHYIAIPVGQACQHLIEG